MKNVYSSEDVLTHVMIEGVIGGKLRTGSFYWRHSRALLADDEAMQEAWSATIRSLGFEPESTRIVDAMPVPVRLPDGQVVSLDYQQPKP